MKVKQIIVVTVSLMVGTMFGVSTSRVEAAFYDRDKLGKALSVRFGLNERDIAAFLADFQYNPELKPTSTPTPISTPTPTPRPTVTPTPTPSATPVPAQVVNGVTYMYNDGTDKYYRASRLVSVQHQNHLDFIETKLDAAVEVKKLSLEAENIILDKLAEMMEKSPSSEEFRGMKLAAQRSAIANFKTEMDKWMRDRDMTLAQLRSMTGKGNKYLMGIYFD
jgi:hypothetical protein